jgi:hypothetical protein
MGVVKVREDEEGTQGVNSGALQQAAHGEKRGKSQRQEEEDPRW